MATHIGNKTEEIGIFDIVADILRHWKIVISVFVVATSCVAIYLFLNPPLVSAKVSILPPTAGQIADYNFGRSQSTEFTPYDIAGVYTVFLDALQSEQLHRKFFTELYLPTLAPERRDPENEDLYLRSQKLVVVVGDQKLAGGRFSVEVKNQDRATAQKWLETYLEWAKSLAVQRMEANVNREAEVRAAGYLAQINDLKQNAQAEKSDKVARLNEALTVAKAVGLESPPVFTSGPVSEASLDMNGDLAYMRGSKALTAELTNLNARKNDDAFIGKLRDLELRHDLYEGIATKQRTVETFRRDGDVNASAQGDTNKRILVLVLCGVLSLCLGMMVASCIAAYKRRWLQPV